jgi:hypothetical protein
MEATAFSPIASFFAEAGCRRGKSLDSVKQDQVGWLGVAAERQALLKRSQNRVHFRLLPLA